MTRNHDKAPTKRFIVLADSAGRLTCRLPGADFPAGFQPILKVNRHLDPLRMDYAYRRLITIYGL
jgi:hypothetical protein